MYNLSIKYKILYFMLRQIGSPQNISNFRNPKDPKRPSDTELATYIDLNNRDFE